jgi:hypothetical protein
MRIKDVITHIFRLSRHGNWTLDRLAAWVQTVEPGHDNPPGSIDPEFLEKASELLASRRVQVRRDSTVEANQEAADEWQSRVSAFTAKLNSGRKRSRITP